MSEANRSGLSNEQQNKFKKPIVSSSLGTRPCRRPDQINDAASRHSKDKAAATEHSFDNLSGYSSRLVKTPAVLDRNQTADITARLSINKVQSAVYRRAGQVSGISIGNVSTQCQHSWQ